LYDCRTCRGTDLQKQRNCPELNEKPQFPLYALDNEDIWYCPVKSLQDEIWEVNYYFTCLSLNHLPLAGGIDDQFVYDVYLMMLIKTIIEEYNAKLSSHTNNFRGT